MRLVISMCCITATLAIMSERENMLRNLASTTFDEANRMIILRDKICLESAVQAPQTVASLEACEAAMIGELYSKSFTYNTKTRSCTLYGTCAETKIAPQSDIGDIYLYQKHSPPHLGWSSWNAYYGGVTRDNIMQQAQHLKDLGLFDMGFKTIHIDGMCRFNVLTSKKYIGRTNLTSKGEFTADSYLTDPPTSCMPQGSQALIQEVKQAGFLMGWYTTARKSGCGSSHLFRSDEYFEQLVENDLRLWKSWGVDVLKLDRCGAAPPQFSEDQDIMELWARKRNEIFPELVFENCRNLCNNGNANAKKNFQSWCPFVADYHRAAGDVRPWLGSIKKQILAIAGLNHATGPAFGWSFGDALHVCNYDWNSGNRPTIRKKHKGTTMTTNLEFVNYAAYAILSSPLYISTKIENCSPEVISLLQNKDILAINQQWSGDSGTMQTKKIKKREIRIFRKQIDTLVTTAEHFLIVDFTDSKTKQQFTLEDSVKDYCTGTPDATKLYFNRAADKQSIRSIMFSCIKTRSGITPSPSYSPTVRSPTTATATSQPTDANPKPTPKPTNQPTSRPTKFPTTPPVDYPTPKPTHEPTPKPTYNPTYDPTTRVTADSESRAGQVASDNQTTHAPIIIGAVIGGCAFVLVIALLLIKCRNRHDRKLQHSHKPHHKHVAHNHHHNHHHHNKQNSHK